MSELSIRFTATDNESPVHVSVSRPTEGVSTDPVTFTPPLDDAILRDLRWYLEVFACWPTGPDYTRAEGIQNNLEDWGKSLRSSVFAPESAARLWQQFLDAPGDGKQITIDATDPRVLRLPWELLADEAGHLFSRRISIRRRLQTPVTTQTKEFALPVRVLVVVCRPDDVGFIDPRAVSEPLVDALDELGGQVEVEFLYPPTLTALSDRLEDDDLPPVHVVHFDGHGVYDADLGLGYLLFEDENQELDRVDAHRLGTLLSNCGIPLMVLNACQSAKQEEVNPYASVAARLIQAGVGSVLAMNYSVLVVAARKFVAAFYGNLAKGRTIAQAVDRGRRALMADVKRHTVTRRTDDGTHQEITVRLSDWFLPALYQQAADPKVFPRTDGDTPPTPRTLPRALTEPNSPGGLPEKPQHGFHGRARELLKLERSLAESAIVVVHGFGGMGKTTLAAEAGRWFHRTGRFPAGAAFVSFEHGGSLQQLCSWVGQAVTNDPNFAVSGDGDPVERITELLRTESALVILDNLESVLGADSPMPPEELKEVLDAVYTWAKAGRTAPNGRPHLTGSRILITTRDTNFNDDRFARSTECTHIELGGLAPSDALALAAVILEVQGIDRETVDRQELVDLMERLGAHPLSLNLVLPHLRDHTAAQLSEDLEALLHGFKTGAAKDRNDSLTVSLKFSLDRLGKATRAALPALAVFQGGTFERSLLNITGIESAEWIRIRTELERAALVSIRSVQTVIPPFLCFHPTLLPYLSLELTASRRAELELRYWQHYYSLAAYLYESERKAPHHARAIALRELPNLRRALDLVVAAGRTDLVPTFTICVHLFMDRFGFHREANAIVERARSAGTQEGNDFEQDGFLLAVQECESLLQQGLAAEAEALCLRLLRDLVPGRESSGDARELGHWTPDERTDLDTPLSTLRRRAHVYALLGGCASEQEHHEQAIRCYHQAIGIIETLATHDDQPDGKLELIGLYHSWGRSSVALGRLDEAKTCYQTALTLSREAGYFRHITTCLCDLAMLATECGELPEASRLLPEAIQMARSLNEPQLEMKSEFYSGRLAQETGEYDLAEQHYRRSARIAEELRDLSQLARTHHQLGVVALVSERLSDAEGWFKLAQGLKDKLIPHDASTLSNLARLCLKQHRLEEADDYARRIASLVAQGKFEGEVWHAYRILAEVSRAMGRDEEAEAWRQKKGESLASTGSWPFVWIRPLITTVVDALWGTAGAADSVRDFLDKLRAGGRVDLASAVQQILDGERNAQELCQSLAPYQADIIDAILARLEGALPPLPTFVPAFIETVITGTNGDSAARGEVESMLPELRRRKWGQLCDAIELTLSGERELGLLCAGLDHMDTSIVRAIIAGVGEDTSPTRIGPERKSRSNQRVEAPSGSDIVQMLAFARSPQAPKGMTRQLRGLAEELATDANVPDELHALGRVLSAILDGDATPDLSALPDELAAKVQALLGEN